MYSNQREAPWDCTTDTLPWQRYLYLTNKNNETISNSKVMSKVDISVNARDQSILRGPRINIELDFWIPSLQLAFEFQVNPCPSLPTSHLSSLIPLPSLLLSVFIQQDNHHYVSEWYSHYTMFTVSRQDNILLFPYCLLPMIYFFDVEKRWKLNWRGNEVSR